MYLKLIITIYYILYITAIKIGIFKMSDNKNIKDQRFEAKKA
jgi:hypothetical protein